MDGRWFRALLMLSVLVWGCSGSETTEEQGSDVTSGALGQTRSEAPKEPEYVIVPRTAKLYVAPKAKAAYVQYWTPEQARKTAMAASARERKKLDAQRKAAAQREEERRKWRYKHRKRLAKKRKARQKRRRKRLKKMTPTQRAEFLEREREQQRIKEEKAADKRLAELQRRVTRMTHGHPYHLGVVLRLLGDTGNGWLKVETLLPHEEQEHCYRGLLAGIQPLRLQLYVRKGDVAKVTSMLVRIELSGHSEVKLQPGVIVAEAGDAQVALVDGFQLKLPVPEHAIATRYKPNLLFEAPDTDAGFSSMAYADQELRFSRKAPLPINPFFQLNVTGTKTVGRAFYATTQTPCGEYTVRAPADSLKPINAQRVTRLGGSPRERRLEEPYLKRGSNVYGADGGVIGRAEDHYPLQEEVARRGSKRCFRQDIWQREGDQPGRLLTVCVDPDTIAEMPAMKVF